MRRALIVDDSKTAQVRLKKMLNRYDLVVDLAISGEDALAYLSHRIPVVIFMDHSMDGMDGFEALKVIKSNPNTAMIPVIMYTAQKGEAYVGQARALGALDTLSKDIIRPSSLERVLATLKIDPMGATESPEDVSDTPDISKSAETTDAFNEQTTTQEIHTTQEMPAIQDEDVPETPFGNPVEEENQIKVDFEEFREQISRLFELNISEVHHKIEENTERVLNKFAEETEKSSEAQNAQADVPPLVVEEEVRAERNRIGIVSTSLLILILCSLIYLVWNQQQMRLLVGTKIVSTESAPSLINNPNIAPSDSSSEILMLREDISRLEDQQERLYDAMTWILDTDLNFAFNRPPLGESLVSKLSSLTYMLENAEYHGVIQINIHLGNFCLKSGEDGMWVLASPETPIANCVMLNSLDIDRVASDYLSLEYMNFEQTNDPIVNGDISIELNFIGMAEPRRNYPGPGADAGTWNAVAGSNNRVSLSFQP